MKKKKVLIIMGRYLPGYKDGGPVRSIKNLIDFLGDSYDFSILTSDRDHGDTTPYKGIKYDEWNQVGQAKVYYAKPNKMSFLLIKKLANEVNIVYVCGCFSDYAIKTLVLNRLNLIKTPLVVASMGLFSPLEFKRKYFKKKVYVTLFNLIGCFKKVYWSTTSEMEMSELMKEIKTNDNIFIAQDLPRKVKENITNKHKVPKQLDIAWLSRISPKKNLNYAIELLKYVKYDISFTIFGPIHDEEYWQVCRDMIKELPTNIKVNIVGEVDSEEVVDIMKKQHIFLFPTLGENYGHVIHEALTAGCPVILSDQTPWQELEKQEAGFVYRLDQKDDFVEAINKYAVMSNDEFDYYVNAACEYARLTSEGQVEKSGYITMFNEL